MRALRDGLELAHNMHLRPLEVEMDVLAVIQLIMGPSQSHRLHVCAREREIEMNLVWDLNFWCTDLFGLIFFSVLVHKSTLLKWGAHANFFFIVASSVFVLVRQSCQYACFDSSLKSTS